MKCKGQKLFSFLFKQKIESHKRTISFYFLFSKTMICHAIQTKNLIYMHIKKTCVFIFFFYKCKIKTAYQLMQASNVSKANRQTLHPTNKPQVSLKLDITSLGRKAHKSKQANNFGMNRLSNKIDINKGQKSQVSI